MSQEVSKETKRYFALLKKKLTRYNNVKKRALKYLFDKKIYDESLASGVITVAILWAASKEGEQLTEETLLMYLGIEPEEDIESENIMSLDPELEDMNLIEALDYTVENF